MEMMGSEAMIWEGHPTWRAMLSFRIKWFLLTLVAFGLHARDAEKTSGENDGQGGLA